ncbi:DUF547 domain-containing protein [uncultured Roseovarius sp.]|uniref:DUF547 domain-containing protein n=1 Tax=uncultured Roseovarius sp. TaxID=293344 RepID=UPI0026386896|nr:DUF547 domain-containing protein [uncultured Roseovarius sp.]
MLRRLLFLALTLSILPAGLLGRWSSSAPEAWEHWEYHDPENKHPINHSAWDKFLQKYVRPDGNGYNKFAYSSVTDTDKTRLETYIDNLTQIEITERARPVQLAYWINLYNALTIKVVLDHYPVSSIRNIRLGGILNRGPWDEELVEIEAESISLNAIEHEILRPIWQDPRIHYAINCASVGCPNLHRRAFTATNVDDLLDQLAEEYLSHPRGFKIEGDIVTVSSIFQWFAYDFGNSEEGVIKHIAQHAPANKVEKLLQIGGISDSEYDWSLNQ